MKQKIEVLKQKGYKFEEKYDVIKEALSTKSLKKNTMKDDCFYLETKGKVNSVSLTVYQVKRAEVKKLEDREYVQVARISDRGESIQYYYCIINMSGKFVLETIEKNKFDEYKLLRRMEDLTSSELNILTSVEKKQDFEL